MTIQWNHKVKLILSDVDETIADLYLPAEPEMVAELNRVLDDNIALFFVTGHGLAGVKERITDWIRADLRPRILIGHCSGVEVWGFNSGGDLNIKPYYSLYDEKMSQLQKTQWRNVMDRLIEEFKLLKYPASPVNTFKAAAGNNPSAIMYDDRGPQITFEMINSYDLSSEQAKKMNIEISKHGHYDLRIPIFNRAEQLLKDRDLPISPRLGGVFALDFVIHGVSKTTSINHVMADKNILTSLGLTENDAVNPENLEIWGDKFSTVSGSDRFMCEAVNPKVRAIDFRQENPNEFLPGYNIVVWNGKKHLQEGLLEYLQGSR